MTKYNEYVNEVANTSAYWQEQLGLLQDYEAAKKTYDEELKAFTEFEDMQKLEREQWESQIKSCRDDLWQGETDRCDTIYPRPEILDKAAPTNPVEPVAPSLWR